MKQYFIVFQLLPRVVTILLIPIVARAMSISEPPSPSVRYSLMPVITDVEVEVFVGEYESATKFFLSPTNLPDHVRKSMCFLFNF